MDSKNSTKRARPFGRQEEMTKNQRFARAFLKKRILRKNRKTCDLQGLLSQKNEKIYVTLIYQHSGQQATPEITDHLPPRTTLRERFSGFGSAFFFLIMLLLLFLGMLGIPHPIQQQQQQQQQKQFNSSSSSSSSSSSLIVVVVVVV